LPVRELAAVDSRKPSFRTNPFGSLFWIAGDPVAKSATARILSEAGSFAGRVAVAHSQTSRPNMFYEPRDVYRGRDEIDRVAGTIKATHPDFGFVLTWRHTFPGGNFIQY